MTVLQSGIYTSIQDLGRVGYAHYGVPISGAMDSYAVKIGNQLLQNPHNASVLEITFGACVLQVDEDVTLCVTGANYNFTVNGMETEMYTVFKVQRGAKLKFANKNYGARTYVCVAGGFASERVLNSQSYYKGITKTSRLQKGMKLLLNTTQEIRKLTYAKVKVNKDYFFNATILCKKGPEFELLPLQQQKELLTKNFSVSKEHNRMGVRLEELIENNLQSILTSGVLPGTVQLTPSGKLIVLMRDCQITGGYPRVLQLTEDGINTLSQKSSGDKIRFSLI